jgi:signal peptidase II
MSAGPTRGAHIMRGYHLLLAAVVVAADLSTKWLVLRSMDLHQSIAVIPGFFRLTHVHNRGAAFGLFADSPSEWRLLFLIVFSVAALIVVSTLLWKSSHTLNTTGVGLALILGGALGNLWDRVVHGYVVDFLDFHLGRFHWPAFNLADSAIVGGALLVLVEILFTRAPAGERASE